MATHSTDLEEDLFLLLNLRPGYLLPRQARIVAASLAETCVEVNCDFIVANAAVLSKLRLISIASEHADMSRQVFRISATLYGGYSRLDITSDSSHLDLIKNGTSAPEAIKAKVNDEWKGARGEQQDFEGCTYKL